MSISKFYSPNRVIYKKNIFTFISDLSLKLFPQPNYRKDLKDLDPSILNKLPPAQVDFIHKYNENLENLIKQINNLRCNLNIWSNYWYFKKIISKTEDLIRQMIEIEQFGFYNLTEKERTHVNNTIKYNKECLQRGLKEIKRSQKYYYESLKIKCCYGLVLSPVILFLLLVIILLFLVLCWGIKSIYLIL